jgi:ATP-binding cassette subfamily C protein/ATP-binding cassette subfamily C protein EexD
MRQRVGLARALYGNPRLLILDEPNSNLDEEGEKALADALAAMKAAKQTVIVVTHRPQVLAHVDRILVMSFGTALAYGPRDEVIARMRGHKVVLAHERAAPSPAAARMVEVRETSSLRNQPPAQEIRMASQLPGLQPQIA